MTRILSIIAVGKLAERRCRELARPVSIDELVAWLESCEVDVDRAHAGVRLAVYVARLDAVTDDEGRACVKLPEARDEVA